MKFDAVSGISSKNNSALNLPSVVSNVAIGFAMALVDDDVVNSRLRMRREEEEEDLMKFLRVDKKVVRASERTQTRKDIVMWIVCKCVNCCISFSSRQSFFLIFYVRVPTEEFPPRLWKKGTQSVIKKSYR
jgi:hypothetical protein